MNIPPRQLFLAPFFCLLSLCISMPTSAKLPLIVAHRAGTADAPENTLAAINKALQNKADMLWLSVQLSKDGEPVLFRPVELSDLTNGSGHVADHSLAELQKLNAGWKFHVNDEHPYRKHPVYIPTLREALALIPKDFPVILDMKAMPAKPLTEAVAQVLNQQKAWSHVYIYSTNADYQLTFSAYPQAKMFESRDDTRTRLVQVALGAGCHHAPSHGTWVGFEMIRDLMVSEKFTLGAGISTAKARLWTPAALHCFREKGDVNVFAFGINSNDDFLEAACLGVNAVLVDSPKSMAEIRDKVKNTDPCPSEPTDSGAFSLDPSSS